MLSVACQPGDTTVVNCLCKSRLNLLTLLALRCVSNVSRALTIPLYGQYIMALKDASQSILLYVLQLTRREHTAY